MCMYVYMCIICRLQFRTCLKRTQKVWKKKQMCRRRRTRRAHWPSTTRSRKLWNRLPRMSLAVTASTVCWKNRKNSTEKIAVQQGWGKLSVFHPIKHTFISRIIPCCNEFWPILSPTDFTKSHRLGTCIVSLPFSRTPPGVSFPSESFFVSRCSRHANWSHTSARFDKSVGFHLPFKMVE